jgi:hypothetical protein
MNLINESPFAAHVFRGAVDGKQMFATGRADRLRVGAGGRCQPA